MASATFSFGSFGDGLALVDHAWGLGQIVLTIASSSSQWATLEAEVRSFMGVLHSLDEARLQQSRLDRHTPLTLPGDIHTSIKKCCNLLSRMEQHIQDARPNTSNIFWRLISMFRWGATGMTKFAEMRSSFRVQIAGLKMLLLTHNGWVTFI